MCTILYSLTCIIIHLQQKGTRGELPKFFLYISPVVLMNFLVFAWEPTFLEYNARPILLVTGLIFFYYTAQVILFSMAHEPFPYLQKTSLPYLALVCLSRVAARSDLPSWAQPVLTPQTVRYVLMAFS